MQCRSYTPYVIRWYRAPELLYGSRDYDQGVDLWAVGCILGEMINNCPLFPGENDIDQLGLVIRHLGTPTQHVWPGVSQLPDYSKASSSSHMHMVIYFILIVSDNIS